MLAQRSSYSLFPAARQKQTQLPILALQQIRLQADHSLNWRGAADKWQAASNRLNPVDSIGLQHNLSFYILQKTTYEKLNNADSVYAQSFVYGNQRFGAAANALNRCSQ